MPYTESGVGYAKGSDTSEAAARSNIPGKDATRRFILKKIVTDWPKRNYTSDEMAVLLGNEPLHGIAPRFTELQERELIHKTKLPTRRTRAGGLARVWGPTKAGVQMIKGPPPPAPNKLPIFTEALSACDSCELKPQLDRALKCYAYRPEKFNGIMLIGEGPGAQEVSNGRPFVGQSGKLLRATLDSIGIEMDECYVTNATLCKPPAKDQALHDAFPHAIPSCLGRLEAEIAAVRPRVIITLGAAAFIAVSGYDKELIKRVKFDCEHCNEQRKVGPVIECSAPKPNEADGGKTVTSCGHRHALNATSKENVDPEEVKAIKAAGCVACGSKLSRVRPKMVKCPECLGLKMREETTMIFEHDYAMSKVAGAIFEPAASTDREPHELDAWYAEQGVAYIVPTYHPAYLLRGQQFMVKAVQKHLAKAKRLLGEDVEWKINYEVTSDPEVVRAYCWAWEKTGGTPPNFSVDLETEAWTTVDGERKQLDARIVKNVTDIRVFGIGSWQVGKALVVDCRGIDPDKESALLDVLQDFVEDDRIPKTYHNGACYDVPVLAKAWGIPFENMLPSYTDDTLGAHTNLYPDEPHDLGHVTFSFTDSRAWKPPRTAKGVEIHKDFEQLALYNARDVLNTDANREAMGVTRGRAPTGGKMNRNKLGAVYEQDSILRRIAVDMTMHGMPVDKDAFYAAGARADKAVAEALSTARELLATHTGFPNPEEFNPYKGVDLIEALYGTNCFNLMVVARTGKTKQPATDAPTFQKLLASTKDTRAAAFIKAVLEVKDHHKTRSTYIYSPKMQPWSDGRIHPVWKPWGTRTGRMSSEPNAQNWPKWLRAFIRAPEGRIFVGADYDQLELRGMADLYGDEELSRRCMTADDQRKLEPEHDPHSFVAQMAFAATYTGLLLKDPAHDKATFKCKCETCKRKSLRDLIKRVIYGLAYGSGDATVLEAIYSGPGGYHGPPITIEMVAHVRKTIFKAFPNVEKGREESVRLAHATEEIRSPLYNRRRLFPLGEIPVTEIYNFPIQSYAADIVNERTILLYDRLLDVDPSAFLFAQVHDAVYVEADENKADAVADLMDEILPCDKTAREGQPLMHFGASATIAKSWKDAA